MDVLRERRRAPPLQILRSRFDAPLLAFVPGLVREPEGRVVAERLSLRLWVLRVHEPRSLRGEGSEAAAARPSTDEGRQ